MRPGEQPRRTRITKLERAQWRVGNVGRRLVLRAGQDLWRTAWGCSSVGRAFDWQSKGRGFESPQLHQTSQMQESLSWPRRPCPWAHVPGPATSRLSAYAASGRVSERMLDLIGPRDRLGRVHIDARACLHGAVQSRSSRHTRARRRPVGKSAQRERVRTPSPFGRGLG